MSNFPTSLDSDINLHLVHDGLRLTLLEDYNPGDTSITVEEDVLFDRFPPTGIITLTEQCSEVNVRALSLNYTSKGDNTFEGLSVVPGFTDVVKPKRITHVTQNVMAEHHNQLKDALIAIERFVGVKGDVSTVPNEGTMEARTNFLRKLVLKPRSWFTVNKRIGIVPLCVEFTDFSIREPEVWTWDFGDGDTVTMSNSGSISKCYYLPDIYDVTLQVENEFGSDSLTIPGLITARVQAPDEATIEFLPTTQQIYASGVLRTRINQLISVLIDTSGEQSLDPIVSYTWDFTDDLTHDNVDSATASYSIGGIYDVKVRTDTTLGAYRITTFEDVIDVVEKFNIWHMIFNSTSVGTTGSLYVYEFGLLSETYKAAHVSSTLSVTRDAGFLTGVPNHDQQYREFRRNNGFAPRSLTSSGDRGSALIFWAGGATVSTTAQPILFREWNGFDNTWTTPAIDIDRQWNWLPLDSGASVYFLFGSPGPDAFVDSPTNQNFAALGLTNYDVSTITFDSTNYLNGADELMQNVGSSSAGNFSVYRGTWGDSSGYFVRNDGVGAFFRIKSFYHTEGTISSPLQGIRKLTDMPGATKFEGQVVSLSNGIYFFNNTGEVVVYSPVSNTWAVGGPGVGSPDFTKLQDRTVTDYDNASNTLLAVSDQSTKVYLFFDYSTKAQMKFNETDLTFTSLPVRPSGEQFLSGLY